MSRLASLTAGIATGTQSGKVLNAADNAASGVKSIKQIDNATSVMKGVDSEKNTGVGGVDKVGSEVGNIAKNLDTNHIPNMTKQDILDRIPDDWNYTEHNGFLHIKDTDGNIRIRIDPSDKVTNYPHVHVYDTKGNLLDSFGNIVDRKSPEGHIPYKNN